MSAHNYNNVDDDDDDNDCNDIDKILDLLPVSGPVSYVTVAMDTCHAFRFSRESFLSSVSKGLVKAQVCFWSIFFVCLATDNDTQRYNDDDDNDDDDNDSRKLVNITSCFLRQPILSKNNNLFFRPNISI